MNISLIICAKNEEKTIKSIIISAKPFVNEIIVIDGHSTDKTVTIAKQQGVVVVKDNGKGKGDGVRTGITKSNYPILVFMDADASHEPKDIPNLIKPIINGRADLVVASRGKGGSDELSGSIEKTIRMLGSLIITTIINNRFHINLTDTQNGFRAMKKSAILNLHLRENGFSIEQEMIIKAIKSGYSISEIPSHEYARQFGKSRINLWVATWDYIRCLLINII